MKNCIKKKINKKFLIHDISYLTSANAKPLRIRFDKIDEFIEIHNEIRCLLIDYGWFDKICNRIKYLVNEKGSTTYSINHKFGKITTDS